MPCPNVPSVPPHVANLHARATVVDLHAHPTLKIALWGKQLADCHRSGGAFDPFSMRVDFPKLKVGGVDVLLSTVYVPERALLADCFPLRIVKLLLPRVRRLFDGDPFLETLRILDALEAEVALTPPIDGVRLEVARSHAELTAARARGSVVFLHAVEGAHHLSGDAANVGRLFDRGVCLMTLAHFYANGIAPPVDGIPPDNKILGCFQSPKDLDAGLTPVGSTVVEEMVRLGMVVDLTHCTPPARRDVLALVGTRRPLVMTHVGAHTLQDVPMNPDPTEVRRIADTGGAIGVIAMNHWLSPFRVVKGIELMVRTARALANQGGVEVVALGTDFDGFTDPPDDLPDHAALPRLTEALLTAGFSTGEVEQILGGNAERVLKNGWGR